METPPKKIYVIFGPPGSGKTVQANYLSKQLKLGHISWGYICNDESYAKKYGALLASIKNPRLSAKLRSQRIARIVSAEVRELRRKDPDRSIVIDGFPRRIDEARALFKIIESNGYSLRALININPSFDVAYERCRRRFVCPRCKKYYDDLMVPARKGRCDEDGSKLVGFEIERKVLQGEFEAYTKGLSPAIEFLKRHAELHFDVSDDDDEIITFSNILLKIKKGVRSDYRLYKRMTQSFLETKSGRFNMLTYQSRIDYTYHLALVRGTVANKEHVLVRVHSSCITGDIFGSSKCDCGEQLEESLRRIDAEGCGIVIYLFQEGRGINIINKIQAYKLQSGGYDTVEANEALGFPPEMRDYGVVREILEDLKVRSISLLTNNPDKISQLTELGIIIQDVAPLEIKSNPHNENYLAVKKRKMNHRLKEFSKGHEDIRR
ncbi:MAG: GTP cyclohydrolase II [Candidatus Taylorbacteria bacterium]|nr:GTP cyclohydrolase II [Candidatus Taylorbacteria bacterium]